MMRKNRLPRRGERGFTLIELLVVVAILGVLAAVVVPNVSRFMGSGKNEAGLTELANVQLAMTAMMADQGLSVVPAVAVAQNAMTNFPDPAALAEDVLYNSPSYGNYIQKSTTAYYFTVETDGTVHGWWETPGVNEIGVDPAP